MVISMTIYETAITEIEKLPETAVKDVLAYIKKKRDMAFINSMVGAGIGDGTISSPKQLREERANDIH